MHSIPVLYYHSIGDHSSNRPWSFLTTPIAIFEDQLAFLARHDYYFADLQELYDHMEGTRFLPARSVVLTFDDGFLDNLVHAFPIARRLGARFTIFVNPEFVEPEPVVRPTLEDVWAGRVSQAELTWWGYLSWEELRLLQQSGVVDIQSHALTHTWYPTSSQVIDFHRPDTDYYWLYWNRYPERKPQWLRDYTPAAVPYGYPVYEHEKALLARVYTPSPAVDAVTDYVAAQGGPSFFEQRDWRQQLEQVYETHVSGGSIESLSEQRSRLEQELKESRRRIEEELQKEVRFLAWPGGGTNAELTALAYEAGYLATTKGTRLNQPGGDASLIFRGSACLDARFPLPVQMLFLRIQLNRLTGKRSLATFLFNLLRNLRQTL